MRNFIKKLIASVAWLGGVILFFAQVYRVTVHYIKKDDLVLKSQDLIVFCIAIVLIYLKNDLKTALRNILNKVSNVLVDRLPLKKRNNGS